MRLAILIFSALLAYVAAGLVVLAVQDPESVDWKEFALTFGPPYLALAVAVIFPVLLVVALIRAFVSASLWIIKILTSLEGKAQPSRVQRLVAFGIVVLLFSSTLFKLVDVFIRMVRTLFADGPYLIGRIVTNGHQCISRTGEGFETPVASCVYDFMAEATRGLTEMVDSLLLRSGLATLPFEYIVFAMVIYALVTTSLTRLAPVVTGQVPFWLGYAAVAAASVYLALSATLAAPLLLAREEQRAPAELPQLRQKLDALIPPTLDAFIMPQIETGALDQRLSAFEFARESVARSFDEIRRRSDELSRQFEERTPGMITSAAEIYETSNQGRPGELEAQQHYLGILRWFRDVVDARNAALAGCRRAFATANDARLRVENALRTAQALLLRGGDVELRVAEDDALAAASVASSSVGDCSDINPAPSTPPSRPPFGASLGPVGIAVGWLLVAESMPLVQITGLVGYGLLGALVGRFVRQDNGHAKGGRHNETVGAVAAVVFNGFVAALIVYLAAQGGLSIATQNGGELNIYVLFAACLIGAVYSARVWDEARLRAEKGAAGNSSDP